MADCVNVTVDTVQDESELVVQDGDVSAESDGSSVTITATVTNNILSGNGSSEAGTLSFSVGGQTRQTSVNLGPGETATFQATIEDVPDGSYDACAFMGSGGGL